MELKRTKCFAVIGIIVSALALICTAILIVMLNLEIGYDVTDGKTGDQVARAIVGVIFVGLLLVVLCGFAIYAALEGGIVLALSSKGRRVGALHIVSAVIKFLAAPSIFLLGALVLGLGFWLVGAVGIFFSACFILLGIFDVSSFKEGKKLGRLK